MRVTERIYRKLRREHGISKLERAKGSHVPGTRAAGALEMAQATLGRACQYIESHDVRTVDNFYEEFGWVPSRY